MKIRKGFVSNSSSQSFVCDVCGYETSGWDLSLSEAEMVECENGHTLCQEHVLEASQEQLREILDSVCKREDISQEDIDKYFEDSGQSIDDLNFDVIDDISREYGYGDGGECITIADPNEVWCMEIMGEGKKKKGGIWAAQIVPDGEVSVSANIPRIKYLNREDPDNFMCSDNIEKVAKKHGLWDGNGEFIWYKVFCVFIANLFYL